MTETRVQVRPARPEDVATIHNFITQLAIFEKCPEKVVATHETIAKTLGLESDPSEEQVAITSTQLGPGQFAKCVIAHVDGQKVGLIVFFYSYSTVSPVPNFAPFAHLLPSPI